MVLMPGTASYFSRNSGTQNECSTSFVWILNSTGGSTGSTSSRADLLLGVLEGPGELLARDLHDHLVLGLGLDVVEHHPAVDRQHGDDDERDRHPDDLEPGVAVDRRAVAHVAGLGAEADDAVDGDRHHEHEDRHREDQQDVVERVDVRGRPEAWREPVDQQRDGDPDERSEHSDATSARRGASPRDARIRLGRPWRRRRKRVPCRSRRASWVRGDARAMVARLMATRPPAE